jgi:hypothetical protein
VLTLLVVPCVYELTDRVATRLRTGISRLGVDIDDPFARNSS